MIQLTENEVKELNGNKDAIAQVLVRKALLEEMAGQDYTEEEKKYIEVLKLNAEIEFYLNKLAQPKVVIYDYELLDVYKNNSELLKDKNAAQVSLELKQSLFNYKLGAEKANIINEIIEKHKINDILKTYVKEETEEKAEEVK